MPAKTLTSLALILAATSAIAGNAPRAPKAALDHANRGNIATDITAVAKKADLIIMPYYKVYDIHGAPNTAFCGQLAGQVFARFHVRNVGNGPSEPTMGSARFSHAQALKPNFYSEPFAIPALPAGGQQSYTFAIPDASWHLNSAGSGHIAGIKMSADTTKVVDEKSEANNIEIYYCLGGPNPS